MPDWMAEFARIIRERQALVAAARNDAIEEAARLADEIEDRYARKWRAGHKSDSHMEGMSDGAGEVAIAIRALAAAKSGVPSGSREPTNGNAE